MGIEDSVRLAGGLFLLYLGYKALIARPADHAARARGDNLPGMYASAFALTITNPQTILSFLSIFAARGLASGASTDHPALIVFGVFAGSVLWWVILSTAVSVLRARFTPAVMLWVNRLSGMIIIGFALWALAGVVYS